MTPFGKMLRQERKDLGMPLGEMAEKLGISTPYASQLENGIRPASSRILEKIIKLFDLSASAADALTRAAAAAAANPDARVTSVTINLTPSTTARDRELANHLALSFNRLSPKAKARLREMLKDDKNG